MKIFQVGGSVRDEILGVEANDKDWVVVGSSPEKMIAKGFKPIGKDFPVFLHPNSNEEYAGKAVHAQGVLDILNFELHYFFQ